MSTDTKTPTPRATTQANPELPSFEQFVAVRQIGAARYSPTGERFAYLSNATGLPALWTQPDGGGFARQLTALSDMRVQSFSWSPDGSMIAFTADLHGDEMNQVFVIAAAGGWPRRLTDEPTVQFTLGDWTPDGKSLVVTGNDRDPTEMDSMLIDVSSGEVTRLVTGGQFYASEVSPDGSKLLLLEFLSNTRQRVWLYDFVSGEKRAVYGVPEGDDGSTSITARPIDWRADGSGFYVLSDEGHEFSALNFVPLDGTAPRRVLLDEMEVEGATLNSSKSHLLVVANRRGRFELSLYALDGDTERELPAPTLPLGVPSGASLNSNGDRLILSFATPRRAANLLQIDLTSGDELVLEQSMLGGIEQHSLVEPESIDYPSFDRDIHAWLYRPQGSGPFPVVVSIHGGPEAQEFADYAYHGLYQYLMSRGIGVLAPNIRGSTGYGKSYQKLIHRDWGGGELRDIEAAADYLAGLEWVDGERLAIFGGSFGGFATLSALTRLPERWAAGVDLVGPANLITFVNSVPPFWLATMEEWVGHPERDEALLQERSPITYADDLVAPLLVIQGANDPRVVKAESDQFVERLRERGVDVSYHVDETAGHGPPGREGWIEWLRLTADFLESHLLEE